MKRSGRRLKRAWRGGLALALTLVAGSCLGDQGEAEIVRTLIEGVKAWEGSISSLEGYLLDRSYVSPWYVEARQKSLSVRPKGTEGGVAVHFVIGPGCCRYDATALIDGEDELWGTAFDDAPENATRAGAAVSGGYGRVCVRRKDDVEVTYALTRGAAAVRPLSTSEARSKATQQEPLRTLLFCAGHPTLGEELKRLYEHRVEQVEGGQIKREIRTVPVGSRDGPRGYKIVGISRGPVWVSGISLIVSPEVGYAPLEVTRLILPIDPSERGQTSFGMGYHWSLSDFTQYAKDRWVPRGIEYAVYDYSKDTPRTHTALRSMHEIRIYDVREVESIEQALEKSVLPLATKLHRREDSQRLQAIFPGIGRQGEALADMRARLEGPMELGGPTELLSVEWEQGGSQVERVLGGGR